MSKTTAQQPDRDGTTEADLQRVLTSHRSDFLRLLERRLGRQDLAEDLLQETLARALTKLRDLRDDQAIVAWFMRALQNATIDHVRRGQVADRALTQFAHERALEQDATASERDSACRCVVHLARSLRPQYAEALQRIEVDEVPVVDFAEEQAISKSNAGVRVFRAREALRREVTSFCGSCADQGCNPCNCEREVPSPSAGHCESPA